MTDYLIIGKNGQLGNALVEDLTKSNKSFVAYSKKELDINDKRSLERIFKKTKPKVIINTSAYHVIKECEDNPLEAFRINCVSVANLARLSKENGSIFVTYSTNYVFDGTKNSLYREDDKASPLQMYGLSKYAGEINALNEYSKGTYIIRTCGIYGNGKKGSRSKKGNFVLKILNESKKSGEVKVSKKQIVNPTYASDLASSTLDLISLKPSPGIYHLVNEGNCSWYDFTKMILKYKKINAKVIALSNKDEDSGFKRPTYSAIGNYKAKKLGIVLPQINSGLERYLDEI